MKTTILIAVLGLAPVFAQTTITGHAPLVSVGGNVSACYGPGNNGLSFATGLNYGNKGVVNVQVNQKQQRLQFEVSVHDALPNTFYVVDVRCFKNPIGGLTTDQTGTGSTTIDLSTASGSNGANILSNDNYWVTLPSTVPAGTFFVDISVPNATSGPIGVGGYGDTYIAGPFNLK